MYSDMAGENMDSTEEITIERLISEAERMREKAYAPYSHFTVGAALETKSGKIYSGCNIENNSYSATMCAERTAIFKAVSDGETEFRRIAVIGGALESLPSEYCNPCAVCLQVMSEFCGPDFEIYVAKDQQDFHVYRMDELLPVRFERI